MKKLIVSIAVGAALVSGSVFAVSTQYSVFIGNKTTFPVYVFTADSQGIWDATQKSTIINPGNGKNINTFGGFFTASKNDSFPPLIYAKYGTVKTNIGVKYQLGPKGYCHNAGIVSMKTGGSEVKYGGAVNLYPLSAVGTDVRSVCIQTG